MTSRRLLVAGTAGSALLALGGTGVGALPPSGWDLLRGRTAVALALCLLGGLVLGAAWWGSRRQPVGHQARASVLWSLPLLAAPPMFSRDLYAYAGQAALVVGGEDPYEVGPGALPGPLTEGIDDVWLDAPVPYGPVWLALAGLVVRLTGDAVVPALLGLRLLAVVGVALTAWALVRLAPDPGRALWLGVAHPLVLLHFVAGGHNDALMVGLMAAGLAVAVTVPGRRGLAAGAALVVLAALVKVPALAALGTLALLVPGWPARLRAAVVVGASALATALVVPLVTGLGWGWLGSLDAGRARLSLFSPLTGIGTALGALDAVLAAGLVVAVLVGAGLLAAAALGRLDPVTALGLTLLAVSVLLPVVQPWYVLWGVCVLAARTGARAAAALGAACLVLALTIAPSGRSVVRPPLYGLPTVLALAAGLAVLNRAGGGDERDVGHNAPGSTRTATSRRTEHL